MIMLRLFDNLGNVSEVVGDRASIAYLMLVLRRSAKQAGSSVRRLEVHDFDHRTDSGAPALLEIYEKN